MEERRGYICGECKSWINPQDIGDGTAWTTACEKGVVVSGLSVPCVPKDIYFTSYYKSSTEKPKRVKRVKRVPGRLFSFNQNGLSSISCVYILIISIFIFSIVGALFLEYLPKNNRQQLDNSVVISRTDLDEIMFQLSENQKQIMALQVTSGENFQKIELLERALLATSLFEILKGEKEWQKESKSSEERKQPAE